jgi:hypothetical protein
MNIPAKALIQLFLLALTVYAASRGLWLLVGWVLLTLAALP